MNGPFLSERAIYFSPRRFTTYAGHKPEWKKALVRLAEGQAIEFFEGV